jgi:hypothetical protein
MNSLSYASHQSWCLHCWRFTAWGFWLKHSALTLLVSKCEWFYFQFSAWALFHPELLFCTRCSCGPLTPRLLFQLFQFHYHESISAFDWIFDLNFYYCFLTARGHELALNFPDSPSFVLDSFICVRPVFCLGFARVRLSSLFMSFALSVVLGLQFPL